VISVALAVVAVQVARSALPQRGLRIATGVLLAGFGVYRLVRSRHFRWVGMRVGSRDLALWSFLMSSAHGAGLMLAPIVLALPITPHQAHVHVMPMATVAVPAIGQGSTQIVWPIAVHSLGYLAVTSLLAFLVYEKVGVSILRRAWFNLDILWAGALIGMGLLSLVL
jgi:hypothetical protein